MVWSPSGMSSGFVNLKVLSIPRSQIVGRMAAITMPNMMNGNKMRLILSRKKCLVERLSSTRCAKNPASMKKVGMRQE